ncbi:MAG: phosphoribosylaminoimidazolesuccinocarboxamide synthase [Armatimonadetes bacterium]|nr:phosphoribosylaminoimidazolesuccinocarboxamide synthase [Armatimonadota bacterium]
MRTDQDSALLAAPGREVILNTDLPGLIPFANGKVRDIYDLEFHLLMVATDRISAYDSILPTGIPDKGRVLNQLSAFWLEYLQNVCPSHFITTDIDQIMTEVALFNPELPTWQLEGRSMLVNKARPLPVEFVVRGYLDGSAWREYQREGKVCGIELPRGLGQGDRLPEPIFTPAIKAQTGHDENITVREMMHLAEPGHLRKAMNYSLAVYDAASAYALERGIILADTKLEFGVFQGEVILIDEVCTPDSSRLWDAAAWSPGAPQPSFDKQFVRDHLDRIGWNHEPPAPALPPDIVSATAERYREIFRRLSGNDLE